MKKFTVIAALALVACDDQRASLVDALCGGLKGGAYSQCVDVTPLCTEVYLEPATRKQAVECVVEELNKALGCEQFRVNSETSLTELSTNTGVDLIFSENFPVAPPTHPTLTCTNCVGWTFPPKDSGTLNWSVQVTDNEEVQDKSVILLHELGHVMEMRFKGGTQGGIHSVTPTDVMNVRSPAAFTPTSLRAMVAEINGQFGGSCASIGVTP